MLDDIIDGTVRDLVNKNDLIEIIRSSDWSPESMSPTTDVIGTKPKQGRDKIAISVLEQAAKMTPQYGIALIDVMIKRVNYIDSVQLKVYDRMISERKRIAAEKRSMGEGQKAEILGKVDRELKEITSGANREATASEARPMPRPPRSTARPMARILNFMPSRKPWRAIRPHIGNNTSLVLSSDSDLYQYLKSISGKQQ